MSNIYIEYLSGCFNENDIEELKQINDTYGFNIEFQERKPAIINAALDELLEQVLLFINSTELQTVISVFNVAEFMAIVIKSIYEKLKPLKINKITSSTSEEKSINIIIQVDNVKILLDQNVSEEDFTKYLRVAMQESVMITKETENKTIVVEGDNDMVVSYHIEEYAKKKIGMKYKSIRRTKYRKHGRKNNGKKEKEYNGCQ